MAAFSFGSFGDLYALIQIASNVYDAIDSAGSISRELSAAKEELQCFRTICTSIEQAYTHNSAFLTDDDLLLFKAVIQSSQACLHKFAIYLDRFGDSRQVVRLARRVQLSLSSKQEIRVFEGRIRGFIAALGVIQTKLCSMEVTAHVSRSLNEPWDQRPMKFQDALGRRYPVPLEVCSTFEGFMSFLQFAFKDHATLYTAVKNRQIWLFTPDNSTLGLWYIILEDHWSHIAKPGVRLGMSFPSYTELPVPTDADASDIKVNRLQPFSKSVSLSGFPPTPLDAVEVRAIAHSTHNANQPPMEESEQITTSVAENGAQNIISEAETHNQILDDESMKRVRFSEPLPFWATYKQETTFKLLFPIESPEFLPKPINYSESPRENFPQRKRPGLLRCEFPGPTNCPLIFPPGKQEQWIEHFQGRQPIVPSVDLLKPKSKRPPTHSQSARWSRKEKIKNR